MEGSVNEPFWADMPEIDEPIPDVLAEMTARTDACLARLHDERESSRFATRTTADLESFRDEYHTRCSRFGETLTDREYADYCAINAELGRRSDPEVADALAAEEEDRVTEGDPFDFDTAANLCPVCAGSGTVTIAHGYARDWETGEFNDTEDVPCDSCEDGLLFTPADAVEVDHAGCDRWLDTAARDYDVTEEVA